MSTSNTIYAGLLFCCFSKPIQHMHKEYIVNFRIFFSDFNIIHNLYPGLPNCSFSGFSIHNTYFRTFIKHQHNKTRIFITRVPELILLAARSQNIRSNIHKHQHYNTRVLKFHPLQTECLIISSKFKEQSRKGFSVSANKNSLWYPL